jgi:hypothetical protein
LAPWTVKINKARATLDVARGERELLVGKAKSIAEAVHGASEQLADLCKLRATKVWSFFIFYATIVLGNIQETELSRLKKENDGFRFKLEQSETKATVSVQDIVNTDTHIVSKGTS